MVDTTTRSVGADQISELACALDEECRHYETLLDLARRQGVLMTVHDLDGIEDNARRLDEGLGAADMLRIRRERLAETLMQDTDPAVGGGRLSTWLANQPPAVRDELDASVHAVRHAAAELAKVNAHNRELASFCLDLVEEEAATFRRCLLEDPAGRYDRGARPTCNAQGSTLRRQA